MCGLDDPNPCPPSPGSPFLPKGDLIVIRQEGKRAKQKKRKYTTRRANSRDRVECWQGTLDTRGDPVRGKSYLGNVLGVQSTIDPKMCIALQGDKKQRWKGSRNRGSPVMMHHGAHVGGDGSPNRRAFRVCHGVLVGSGSGSRSGSEPHASRCL
jgi:hypothetical protein